MAEVDVVLLLAVRQPRVRPLALGEPVHEGVDGSQRLAGLLGLMIEGVGAVGGCGR
ncbi:hypothetical protein [Streptomyces albogriseolus]|uniref:hypothetical protein n=1 Tax=Streptomyces albogriseolus TaxID=1887 RepID=UPI003CEC5A5D